MDGSLLFLLVLGVAILWVVNVVLVRQKVIDYVLNENAGAIDLKVSWTLFGALAPGSGNLKFLVRFKDMNGQRRELMAVASFWGDVFLREE